MRQPAGSEDDGATSVWTRSTSEGGAEHVEASRIPELLTEKELCEFLRISPKTAWRYRSRGELGFCRYGVRILYLRRHLLAFLEAHEVKPRGA